MNRLVIIGNGFDLAHGLKTSYNNFFEWLWKETLTKSNFTSNRSKHDIFKTQWNIENDLFDLSFTTNDVSNNHNNKDKYSNRIKAWDTSFEDDRGNTININYTCKNSYFNELLFHKIAIEKWSDMEKTFFRLLSNTSVDIRSLNNDFDRIKKLFEKYLTTIETHKITHSDIISDAITKREGKFINQHLDCKNTEVQILNFNYTDTINKYAERVTKDFFKLEINYIHGKLNNIENPIIFGYGDERGEEYKKIELLDNNDYFEHIKSFAYLNTSNYDQLISFLESDAFDVVIIGHSCGLTDRTLLNTIFEHENCTSIKPLYRKLKDGTNNYQDIVRNISRNFDDKVKMRKIVVKKPLTESYSFS